MGTSLGGEGGLSAVRSVCATGFLHAAGLREHFTMRACPGEAPRWWGGFRVPLGLWAGRRLGGRREGRGYFRKGLSALGRSGRRFLGR